MDRVRQGESFQPALSAALAADQSRIEATWRRDIARRYAFVPVFVGGALSWMIVALFAFVRRVRQRRARALVARRLRRVEARRTTEAHSRPAARRSSIRVPRPRGEPMPYETEVPKVEHGGRWYTLH